MGVDRRQIVQQVERFNVKSFPAEVTGVGEPDGDGIRRVGFREVSYNYGLESPPDSYEAGLQVVPGALSYDEAHPFAAVDLTEKDIDVGDVVWVTESYNAATGLPVYYINDNKDLDFCIDELPAPAADTIHVEADATEFDHRFVMPGCMYFTPNDELAPFVTIDPDNMFVMDDEPAGDDITGAAVWAAGDMAIDANGKLFPRIGLNICLETPGTPGDGETKVDVKGVVVDGQLCWWAFVPEGDGVDNITGDNTWTNRDGDVIEHIGPSAVDDSHAIISSMEWASDALVLTFTPLDADARGHVVGVASPDTVSVDLGEFPFLPLAGGTMEGDIDMDGHRLENVGRMRTNFASDFRSRFEADAWVMENHRTSTGGWARAIFRFVDQADNRYYSIGALGIDQDVNFGYLGEFNDSILSWYTTGMGASENRLWVNGQNTDSADYSHTLRVSGDSRFEDRVHIGSGVDGRDWGNLVIRSPSLIEPTSQHDDYALNITWSRSGGGNYAGISFGVSNSDSLQTPGAAITHERTGSWSEGMLHFWTKTDDAQNAPIAKGLSINESQQVVIYENMDANDNKIVMLADPEDPQDAVNLRTLEDHVDRDTKWTQVGHVVDDTGTIPSDVLEMKIWIVAGGGGGGRSLAGESVEHDGTTLQLHGPGGAGGGGGNAAYLHITNMEGYAGKSYSFTAGDGGSGEASGGGGADDGGDSILEIDGNAIVTVKGGLGAEGARPGGASASDFSTNIDDRGIAVEFRGNGGPLGHEMYLRFLDSDKVGKTQTGGQPGLPLYRPVGVGHTMAGRGGETRAASTSYPGDPLIGNSGNRGAIRMAFKRPD